MAFAQNTSPTFVKQPNSQNLQITNANGQTFETGYTAGANGSKIIGVIVSSTDTSARDITMAVYDGTLTNVIAQVNIPITAGNVNTTAAVNMLSSTNTPGLPLDNDGNPFLYLPATFKLQFNAPVSVTSGKFLYVLTIAADF